MGWQAARLQTAVTRLVGRHLLVTGLVGVDLCFSLAEGARAAWLSKLSAVWVREDVALLGAAVLSGLGSRFRVAWQAARLQIVVTLSHLLLLVVDLGLWRIQEGM